MSHSENRIENPVEARLSGLSRRSFFEHASLAGTATALGLFGLAGTLRAFADQPNSSRDAVANAAPTSGDVDILSAAAIAEALAVTTYTGIVSDSGWFTRIPDDDQGYLYAARQEEMSHYLLASSATGKASPFTTFYYPKGMFSSAQVTLNTLVALEDAFIAAYLVGVRYFSNADLRVTAARIMGIESDHRTLARSLAGDVASQDGGPITKITGLQGVPENVHPPNNNGYERTLCLTNISQAVTALLPFVDKAHAHSAGFDTTKPHTFDPFTPHLATPLGELISFTGC
jgi:Ferritin-like domain